MQDILLTKEKMRSETWIKSGKAIILVTFFVGTALAWKFTSLSDYLSLALLTSVGEQLWNTEFGPIALILAMAVATIFMVPVNLLTMAAILFLRPFPAVVTTFLGSALAAGLTYHLARYMGSETVFQLAGKHVSKVKEHPLISKGGSLTIAMVRVLPVAPYTVVSLVMGACKVRFRDFIIGTMLGLLPGKIIVFFFADTIRKMMLAPTTEDMVKLGMVLFGTCLLLVPILRWWKKRVAKQHSSQAH